MRIFKKSANRNLAAKPTHGLKSIPARRSGLPRFNYFRGTPQEFGRLDSRQVASAFESAGFALQPSEAERVSAQLKEKVSAVSDFMLNRKNRAWLERAKQDFIPGMISWDYRAWTPIVAPSGAKISGFAYWEGGKAWIFDVNTSKGDITFRVAFQKDGRIAVYQQPVTHGVYPSISKRSPGKELTHFDTLKEILETKFEGKTVSPPWIHTNVEALTSRRQIGWFGKSRTAGRSTERGITYRDRFLIEMMAPHRHEHISRLGDVREAQPGQILRVTIQLDGLASDESIAEKKAFYRKEIQKKYGIPVSFLQEKGK